MIIQGELEETHRARLASLDRPVHVHVVPLGSATVEGVRRIGEFAKVFKRHRFYIALRIEQNACSVIEKLKEISTVSNIDTWCIEGDIRGTEVSRWHTSMEARASAATEVEARPD